jgi:CubicO group peptidase (beta-lactamase class C family)
MPQAPARAALAEAAPHHAGPADRRDVDSTLTLQTGAPAMHPTVRLIALPAGILAAVLLGMRPLPAQTRPAPAPTRAPARPAKPAEFDAYVARAVRDWRAPGLAIAVVKDDSVVFAKGYGVRDVGAPTPVDAHTRFAIGSTTKAMTALALAMLVDEGKVRWDDPVIDHLPGFRLYDPYVTRDLRVRDLLIHTSGLGNADLLWTGAGLSGEEIVRRMRYFKPAAPLRTQFLYQNVMYAVAGDVVEALSGMSWEQFLHTRIFGPLGMRETEALVSAIEGKPNVAVPHAVINDSLRTIPTRSTDPVKAAGSVYSSVSDMARWMRFMLDSGRVSGQRLVSDASIREIFTPQTLASRDLYPALTLSRPHFFAYGLGWFLQDYQGEGIAMHTGSIDGMSAIIALVPERRFGVFVLANADHVELRHALMYKAIDAWLGTGSRDWSTELHALFTEEERQARERAARALAARATGTSPSVPLERYAGTYSDSTFGDVVVSSEQDGLRIRYGTGRIANLEHWEYDTFRARWEDRRLSQSLITFVPDGRGGVSAVRVFGTTFSAVAPRAARR